MYVFDTIKKKCLYPYQIDNYIIILNSKNVFFTLLYDGFNHTIYPNNFKPILCTN